jgi:hypothetical protein
VLKAGVELASDEAGHARGVDGPISETDYTQPFARLARLSVHAVFVAILLNGQPHKTRSEHARTHLSSEAAATCPVGVVRMGIMSLVMLRYGHIFEKRFMKKKYERHIPAAIAFGGVGVYNVTR